MKQYVVFNINGDQIIGSVGDTLELAKQETEAGATITVDKVLFISNQPNQNEGFELNDEVASDVLIGKPNIAGASVELKIEKHDKGKKIRIIKFRRRQDSKTQHGHRQQYTQATLTAINLPA